MQAEKLNFTGATNCIEATVATVRDLRKAEEWRKIWECATTKATTLNILSAVKNSLTVFC